MKIQLHENSRDYAVYTHPIDIIEPERFDDDVLQAVETYNKVSHWLLANPTPLAVGTRALCILKCAQRERMPRGGIFRSVENDRAELMVKRMLIVIFEILVDEKNLICTGRKVASVLSRIRKEILGAKTLEEIGGIFGCKKQAISQNQARFEKKLQKKLSFRSDRGKRVGKAHVSAVG